MLYNPPYNPGATAQWAQRLQQRRPPPQRKPDDDDISARAIRAGARAVELAQQQQPAGTIVATASFIVSAYFKAQGLPPPSPKRLGFTPTDGHGVALDPRGPAYAIIFADAVRRGEL